MASFRQWESASLQNTSITLPDSPAAREEKVFTPAMEVEISFCLLHTNYLDILPREAWCEKLSFCNNPVVLPYPCVEYSSVLSHTQMERMFKKWWETTPEGKTFSWLTPFTFSTANVAISLQIGLKTHSSQQHFIEDLEKGRSISPEDYLT